MPLYGGGVNNLPLLDEVIAAGDSAIDLAIPAGHDRYLIDIIQASPSVDDKQFWMRTSANEGVAFSSGAGNYGWELLESGTASNAFSDSEIQLTKPSSGVGNAANESWTGQILVADPGAAKYTRFDFMGHFFSDASIYCEVVSGSGDRRSNGVVNYARFQFDTGLVAGGIFRCYGLGPKT